MQDRMFTSRNRERARIVPYILVFFDDEKTRAWSQAAEPLNVKIVALRGTPILGPVLLLCSIVKRGLPKGIVFRYLNDYPSVLKAVMRAISEWVVVILSRVLRIPVGWICHNVDRETKVHFRRLSEFRRGLISRFAKRIFVTDLRCWNMDGQFFLSMQQRLALLHLVGQPSGTRHRCRQIGRPSWIVFS